MTFEEREKLYTRLNIYWALLNKRKDTIIHTIIDKYLDDDCAEIQEMIYDFLLEDPKYNDLVTKADKLCHQLNA